MNIARFFFHRKVNKTLKRLVNKHYIYNYRSKSIYGGFYKIIFKTNNKNVVINIANYDYKKFKSELLYELSRSNNEFKLEWLKIIQ